MKLFKCQNCGNTIHFNNDICLACNSRIGYVRRLLDMSALQPNDDGSWTALAEPTQRYFFCENATEGACNWLVPADGGDTFCLACRFNLTIPDLSIAENHDRWRRIEQAKKHLFYSLTRWNLPTPRRADDPDHGLAFEFLADVETGNGMTETVLTGHNDGLIQINIAEADDAERERRRALMGEPYRTLIGHFRHEVGHFYWDLLVKDRGGIAEFAKVFGDPDIDYGLALQNHYANGAPLGWQQDYISAYASSHPWEDFAETWAHCFHMVDGLETARAYGIYPGETPAGGAAPETEVDPYDAVSIDQIIAAWIPLTVAINSINRSLGQPDLYPFVLTDAIVAKIDFVFRLIADARAVETAAAA